MHYLIADIESVVDIFRVVRTEAGGAVKAGETIETTAERIIQEICAKQEPGGDDCFVPARFHAPVVVVMLVVNDQMQYCNHMVIASKDYKDVTKRFWAAYTGFPAQLQPFTLVTFNGLRFDMPVLENCALDYGVQMPTWLKLGVKPWDDPRHPTSHQHLDLSAVLSSKGALGGSLSYWARNAGLPGKVSTTGASVADMLAKADGLEALVDYCTTDVLNTYGLLYRTLYCAGQTGDDYRGRTYEDTMEKLSSGRGLEVEKFNHLYRANGLF